MEPSSYSLKALLDSFGEPIMVIDRECRITHVNAALLRDPDWRELNPVGHRCQEVFRPFGEKALAVEEEDVLQAVWETGEAGILKHLHHSINGERPLEIAATPLKDEEGRFHLVILSLRNVSDRLAAEQQLRQQNRELSTLNVILSSFSASVSLRTILDDSLERILQLTGMIAGGIRIVDEKTGEVVCAASNGLSEELLTALEQVQPGETAVGQVTLIWKTVSDNNGSTQPNGPEPRLREVNVRSFVVLPVKADTKTIGAMALASGEQKTFSAGELRFLASIASAVGTAAENARVQEEMRHSAVTDGLTGLYNHRHFYQRLEEEINHASRYNEPLSVLFIDVDQLKAINDTYGHPAGDSVLREFAKIIQECGRRTDIVARYGGDEFCVILPHTSCEQASLFGQRLLRKLESHRFFDAQANYIRVAASLGAACLTGPTTPEDLVRRADQAAYKAKQLHCGIVY